MDRTTSRGSRTAIVASAKPPPVLAGMVLVGVGTFFTQAVGTGFIGRAVMGDRAPASGLYLASYYLGGITGAAVFGQLFDHLGWTACVVGVTASLALATLLGIWLQPNGRRR